MPELRSLYNKNANMSETQLDEIPLILIVDDDRTMRSLLNLAMEEEGYEVAEAENGEQCLAEYTHFQPDLILLDAVMPDIDGFTCCQKIRSLPGGDRLPILIITVLDDQESVEQAFRAGATDYITKPIHWSVLSQRVHRLLDNSYTWAELTVSKTKLAQQQSWSELISNLLQQLSSAQEKDNFWERALDTIREWFKSSRIVFSQPGQQIHLQSVIEESSKNFLTTNFNLINEYREYYQQGQPIVIEDVSQAYLPFAMSQQLRQLKTQALLLIPIQTVDRTLGLLEMHFSEAIASEQFLISRLSDLGNLLAIAISQHPHY